MYKIFLFFGHLNGAHKHCQEDPIEFSAYI